MDTANINTGVSVSLGQLLRAAEKRLEAVTETPRLDAEILLAHSLGWTRARLLARLREIHPTPGFDALLARRLNFEPIAYILGEWDFFSMTLNVRPPMLVPRPETEHLVEAALEFLNTQSGPCRILDLCTSTGCVALAIARHAPHCRVWAADINPEAVTLARENANKLSLSIELREGDLFLALESGTPPFDVIVSNPPYVAEGEWAGLSEVIRRHEDRRALLAGEDGLALIRQIIAQAPAFLRPGGLLALEMGETHHEQVAQLLQSAGFWGIQIRDDLAGLPRIAQAFMHRA